MVVSAINHECAGKILLLEDEPIICRAASRTLTNRGFEVDIAANGLIAKEKVDMHNEYEFLIFDIKTPIMNGIQVFEYLEKEYPELANRVIFTTGDSLGAVTKNFLERVNRPFLSKPYTPAQLIALIREVFSVNV
jgi:CheY-like chemotaxis protein